MRCQLHRGGPARHQLVHGHGRRGHHRARSVRGHGREDGRWQRPDQRVRHEETCSAHTGGGNLDASFTATPEQVEAESEGGNITVRLPEGTYAVDAKSDGGDRELGIASDPSSSRKVKAHTGGGNVTIVTTS
ncbi:DUF4097 family beta strand repeat-containing protein [Streptomyces venezuelae]|uniref:DUF4097 family beta strand repeat-containing protein n=1 Tax=Streptomyces venezuelae TaxID=54571 RepID=UPI0016807D39|nr:DUF4097 family beta strand repeat-containing protein [Streptomyces venezuelae]